jgi:hypothetical protein
LRAARDGVEPTRRTMYQTEDRWHSRGHECAGERLRFSKAVCHGAFRI